MWRPREEKKSKRGVSVGASRCRGLKAKSTKKLEQAKSSDDKDDGAKSSVKVSSPESNKEAKYYRATLDVTTNKTCYYNKKIKEVSWIRPQCLEDKKDSGKDATSGGEMEEVAALGLVAEER